ncbi:F-box/kelch-repeat protein At3g23880 [Quercus suber]|uniref:F-box/kelch-repeat protein At3g23880 n=1 Tax=Quercus suber TaxID=58331 RepID=UPI000CE1F0EE|nr:F-box/kelch-repeat protein At3g23880-like [Quercus suber]
MLRRVSTSYLPEAIVENILSRLPPKTLIRFRCVSKTWLAFIGTPDFLSKNILNHSILVPNDTAQNPNPPFLLVKAFNNKKHICNFLSYDTLDCLFHVQVQLDLPSPGPLDLQIVASCHGLICLYNAQYQGVYLWNPTTLSSSSSSSSSGLSRLPPVRPRPNWYCNVRVGFGFDPISNDFKVVRVGERFAVFNIFENGLSKNSFRKEIEAEVYRVSSGSWRRIDLGPIIFGLQWGSTTYLDGFQWGSTTYMNGVFFWWTKQKVDDNIIAFDFSDENFKTTPLPEIGTADTCSSRLTVLNSFVAILVIPFDRKVKGSCFEIGPHFVDIWVLLEFGVKESWNKLFTITTPSTWRRPLGFWKNGELFIENGNNQLVLYDPFTKIEKNLQLNGIEKYFGSFPNYFQVVP